MIRDRRRVAVFAAGLCAFLVFYAPQAVLPQLAASLNVSPAAAGSMVGITTLAVAFSAPVVGLVADRFGCKPTILAAILLLSIPTLLLIEASSLSQMLLWRFAQGLFLPAIFSATVAYVNEEWPPSEAADVMGSYVAATGLGGFCGRFVTALLAEHFGWKTGFIVLTGLTLVCAAIVWRWLPKGQRPFRRQIATKERLVGEATGFAALGRHMTNATLIATFAVGFAVLFALVAVFTYVNFLLAQAPFNFGPTALGMIFLVYPVGAAVTPISGRLIRRFGRPGAMTLVVALSVAGLGVTLIGTVPFIVAGLILFVTGMFLAQASAMGFAAQAAPYAKSVAVGLYVCFYYIGGSLGSVLPGLFWHRIGWPGCVALVLAILTVAVVLVWRSWRR